MCRKFMRSKLDVAETRMLRWMFGATKHDMIRTGRNRGTTKVGEIFKNVQEKGFKLVRSCWYGHTMRRDDEYMSKILKRMDVQGRSRK